MGFATIKHTKDGNTCIPVSHSVCRSTCPWIVPFLSAIYRPRPTRFWPRCASLITCLWLGASLTRVSRESVMARRVITNHSQTVSYCLVGRLRCNQTVSSTVEQSQCWEAACSAASQEITRILLHPTVHYLVHNSPSLLTISSQLIPTDTLSFSFFEIHFNIIPSVSRSSKYSFPFRFSAQNSVCISLSCHMPRPAHPSSFNHPNTIRWAVKMKLLSP